MDLKFIVTGTGRCGTVFMARLLTSLGISCGHESIFTNQGLDLALRILDNKKTPRLSDVSKVDILTHKFIPKWVNVRQLVADSSYVATPYLNHERFCSVPVIHVVRHPLKVISSFVKDLNYFQDDREYSTIDIRFMNMIYSTLPEMAVLATPLEKATYFYIYWNQLIEKSCRGRPYYFHRIEDAIGQPLLEFLNVPAQEDMFNDTKINSHRTRDADFHFKEIPGWLQPQLLSIMKKYKYVKI